jgi:hypothetical protein
MKMESYANLDVRASEDFTVSLIDPSVGKGKRLLLCANGSDHMLVLAATDTQLAQIRDTISEYLGKQEATA